MVDVLVICVSLVVLFLLPAGIILYRFLWIPLRIQNSLKAQGIKGPSYTFIHGYNKEAIELKKQASKTPMDLSHDIFPKVHPHLYTWTRLYGNVFLNWFGSQPQIVVTDPEMAREILGNKDGTYQKIMPRYFMRRMFGDGVFVARGEKWMKLRKLAIHAFHGECLKDMFPAMVVSVENVVEKWGDYVGKEIEVCSEFKFLTAEVLSRTAFGSSYLEGRTMFNLLTKLGVINIRNLYSIRKLVKTEDEIEAEKIEQLLNGTIAKMVKSREDEVAAGQESSYGSDYLGSLLNAHHSSDPKRRISLVEIIDECKSFYIAGQDTTASLLSWCTLLLALNVDWQEKVRMEVLELFGQENPTSDGITRLKTVGMILYETLRLYPAAVSSTRRIASKVKLGKYEFPPNVEFFIVPPAIHCNPNIWGEDAQLFKPERFYEGLAKATDGNPTAFRGFGFGPRMCLGANFAMNEAKIALSMILQRYKFTLSPKYVHSPHVVFTPQPEHGVQILLQSL